MFLYLVNSKWAIRQLQRETSEDEGFSRENFGVELRETGIWVLNSALFWELGNEKMGENVAALQTAVNSVLALGRGFDVNFDTRLLYCKGVSGSRIVEVDQEHTRDLWLYDDVFVPNVSRDIKNFHESFAGRQSSGVCAFNEVRTCFYLYWIFRFPYFCI